ncbi:MAG: hypothetical protein DYG94_07285 [Leptolyngbya sp. PLA3]|nr:MAG: hypothetical protein EDM82_06700 [Cyanobacteria bacterium CYA]MCE7968532.1 hypothetical protein [Leptolyngbya sp. PL-A3]
MGSNLSETAVGAVGEALVAARLAISSAGRLMPFAPIADDGGLDLLVHDRLTGRSWPLQVKCRTKTIAGSKSILQFQVRKATFNAWPNAFLLAAFIDIHTEVLSVRRAWLVPMRALPAIAKSQEKNYVIRPSWSDNSCDKYTQYRCTTMGDVVQRLLAQ